MHRILLTFTAAFALDAAPSAADSLPLVPEAASSTIVWHDGYHAALEQAERERKLVLLWFDDSSIDSQEPWTGPIVQSIQERYVAARLSIRASAGSGDERIALLDHPAFVEMRHSAGLAIVDMTDKESPHFRQVVSVYPFTRGGITPEKLAVLLDLPRGSLTQRTLIFTVRTHPEAPASTAGHLSQILTRETENHAWRQASITFQGHHNWNARFHAINAELPSGLAAREVCAESWPGQGLLEAAEECVDSWRQSAGHWEAVSSRHLLFGYDMKRGANGVWYAAGIFAGR